MIFIKLIEPEDDDWRNWKSRCEAESKKLIEAKKADIRAEIKIDDDLYKEMKHSFYFNNSGPFFGKCAYCEQTVSNNQNQPGDVEHFRPKGKVCNIDNEVVIVRVGDEEVNHPGYYWLAYEWTNLLPSCAACNRRLKVPHRSNSYTGKGMRFPVTSEYAVYPGEEAHENCLLINPCAVDPAKHLEFDKDTGVLNPISKSGDVTEKILGLNQRNLPTERKKAHDNARAKLWWELQLMYSLDSVDFTPATKVEGEKTHLQKTRDELQSGVGQYLIATRVATKRFDEIIEKARPT